jgi:hypothetical protein
MKKILLRSSLLLILALLVSAAGCSLFGIEFVNNSSRTVEVHPVDQDWEFFILDPGDRNTIHPSEGYASFLYFPTTVICDDSQSGKVVFRDR